MTEHIADISDYQVHFDAHAYAKAGHKRIRIKASEGTTYNAGAIYVEHVTAAHNAGLAVDHYHFLHPGNGSGQAAYFLSIIAPHLRPGDRLMADCEAAGLNGSTVAAFVDRCNAGHPNYPGLIYGGPYFLRDNHIVSRHGWGIVLADYTTASKPVFWPGGFPKAPREWQNSDGKLGAVYNYPGLGHVDSSIVVKAGKTPKAKGTPKPAPKPKPSPRAPHDLTRAQNHAIDLFLKHMNARKHAPTQAAKDRIQSAINAGAYARDIKP